MLSPRLMASLAILIALTAGPSAARADITVGLAAPLSGAFQPLGVEMKNGAEAAVADINATGVLGQKLKLVELDDACDVRQAVLAAGQLVAERAAFVAGHLCSAASIAAATAYAAAQIIQISPGSTAAAFTDERAGPGTFRVSGRADRQGGIGGAYLARAFSGKKVAFLDDRSAYGHDLAAAALAAFRATGQKETLVRQYEPGARDYKALVTVLQAAAVNALFVGGSGADAGLVARELKDAGMATTMVGGDTLASDEFFKTAGDASDGVVMTALPDPRADPANAALVGALRQRQIDPAGYTLRTYAAFQVWAEAVSAAGTTDYAKVTAALDRGTFHTVLGTLQFDGNGDPSLPGYDLYVWKYGNYAPLPQ